MRLLLGVLITFPAGALYSINKCLSRSTGDSYSKVMNWMIKNIPIKSFLIVVFIYFGFLFSPCFGKIETHITGRTMGTFYNIKVVTEQEIDSAELKSKIDKRLIEINRSMSTYDKTSEISRFNALDQIDKRFEISNDFSNVMSMAEELHRLTDGAWDGTVFPLIKLWGFGPGKPRNKVPEKNDIERILRKIGFSKIRFLHHRYLVKHDASISLDFASIAKGYGVDQVSILIKSNNIKDFLVEIGGEIYASGFRQDGKPWHVGVNRPLPDAPLDQVYQDKALEISDRGFATSGDYRNFFVVNGKRYSHIIDPKTGYPVTNNVVSASVIADFCTFADGLATALMVMGPEKGLALVNRLDRVECLIIVMNRGGNLVDYYSEGMQIEE